MKLFLNGIFSYNMNFHISLTHEGKYSPSWSSRSQMFFKIGGSQKFRKFYRKTPVLVSLLNKFVGLKACNFTKKRHQHRCFLVKFAYFFTTLFLQNTAKAAFAHHANWLLFNREYWSYKDHNQKINPKNLYSSMILT